jgi:hypothetical protein
VRLPCGLGPWLRSELSDSRLLESDVGSLDILFHGSFSLHAINRLGGCSADSNRIEVSNIGLTFAQADLSRTLCAYAERLPNTGDFVDEAARLILQIWHRSPRPGEPQSIAADMQACLDAAGTNVGCADPEPSCAGCRRMLDSAEFATETP